jgi:hypothetical protein
MLFKEVIAVRNEKHAWSDPDILHKPHNII